MLRVLAPAKQMGAVLGIKGATIRQLSADTGTKVVVLPRQDTPSVGQATDEVLQLEGRAEQVRACKAVHKNGLWVLREGYGCCEQVGHVGA